MAAELASGANILCRLVQLMSSGAEILHLKSSAERPEAAPLCLGSHLSPPQAASRQLQRSHHLRPDGLLCWQFGHPLPRMSRLMGGTLSG